MFVSVTLPSSIASGIQETCNQWLYEWASSACLCALGLAVRAWCCKHIFIRDTVGLLQFDSVRSRWEPNNKRAMQKSGAMNELWFLVLLPLLCWIQKNEGHALCNLMRNCIKSYGFSLITLACKKCHILYFSRSVSFCSRVLITWLGENPVSVIVGILFLLCGPHSHPGFVRCRPHQILRLDHASSLRLFLIFLVPDVESEAQADILLYRFICTAALICPLQPLQAFPRQWWALLQRLGSRCTRSPHLQPCSLMRQPSHCSESSPLSQEGASFLHPLLAAPACFSTPLLW